MGQLFSICGLLYIRDCDVMKVVDDISLFPPYPKYYRVDVTEDRFTGTYGYDTIENNIPECISIRFINVTSDISICLMHFKSRSSKRVIIQSHGNAVDIGCCIHNMLVLGQQLDTDIIIYDYEGFGCSNGVATFHSLTRDLSAVYDYARQFFHGKDIFLIGESIGSVPTCEVAASLFKDYEKNVMTGINPVIPLGGIILQAAIYTGRSILPTGCLIQNRDPYDNAKFVKSIHCPIFHIHGTDDEIISFSKAKALYEVSKSPYPPWWVEEGKHNDIIIKHEKEYIERLLDFMNYCDSYSIVV